MRPSNSPRSPPRLASERRSASTSDFRTNCCPRSEFLSFSSSLNKPIRSFVDCNLADNAALHVFDHFVLAGNHERAPGEDRTAEWSDSGPNTETAEPNDQDRKTGEDRPFGAEGDVAIPRADAVVFCGHALF